MEAKQTIIIVATIFVITFFSGTTAQAQAPAPVPAAVTLGPSAEAPAPAPVPAAVALEPSAEAPAPVPAAVALGPSAKAPAPVPAAVALGPPAEAPAPEPAGVALGPSAEAPAPEPAAVALGPSAEAPTPDCITNLLNLTDCLTYVQAGSNLTKPDKPCCPELAGLVESSPQCLCYLMDKNATASYGLDIDINRALNLPTVCHVSVPPASLCSAINGAPVEAPTPIEGSMSPGGLAASPSSGNSTDGASNIAVSGLASFFALAIACFLPTLFGI